MIVKTRLSKLTIVVVCAIWFPACTNLKVKEGHLIENDSSDLLSSHETFEFSELPLQTEGEWKDNAESSDFRKTSIVDPDPVQVISTNVPQEQIPKRSVNSVVPSTESTEVTSNDAVLRIASRAHHPNSLRKLTSDADHVLARAGIQTFENSQQAAGRKLSASGSEKVERAIFEHDENVISEKTNRRNLTIANKSNVVPASFVTNVANQTTVPDPIVTITLSSTGNNIEFEETRAFTKNRSANISYQVKNATDTGSLILRVSPKGLNPDYFKIENTGGGSSISGVKGVQLSDFRNVITAYWRNKNGTQFAASSEIIVNLDATGPVLRDLQPIIGSNQGNYLSLRFTERAWGDAVTTDAFTVYRQDKSTGEFNDTIAITAKSLSIQDSNLILPLPSVLPPGSYKLKILNSLSDKLGNEIELPNPTTESGSTFQLFDFTVSGSTGTAEHVEFPQWAPPRKQNIPLEGFNPGDKVETRTARLYYFRDAHRVAQIINRNIRSLNKAAVEQAERRAQNSRELANNYTDQRRKYEREAIQAAKEARNAENVLFESRRALQTVYESTIKVQELKIEIDQIDLRLENIESVAKEVTGKAGALKIANDKVLAQQQVVAQAASDFQFKSEAYNNSKLEYDQILRNNGAATAAEKAVLDAALAQRAEAEKVYQLESNTLEALNEDADRQENEYVATKNQLDVLETPDSRSELEARRKRLFAEKSLLETELNGSEGAEGLKERIPRLEVAVANLRSTAIAKQEASTSSQAKEDRERERQFRLEVTAAKEDPDTYVAGNINSLDPITQCSLSVIGEGLIQIRGPIKGINKIRTLINQIDSPLGQIKVGINTVQVNGEKVSRMERVVGRIEGQIDLSRFLTSQSLLMLRKAIQEYAGAIAVENERGLHQQVDRDRKYLYAFFGRDFIDELYEMDSEFLHSENKILSLHSMDTISMNRALFILALAKNDVRSQIIDRFMDLVACEMPQIEWDFRRSSELTPHKSRLVLPIFDKEKYECHTLEGVTRKVKQRYHFRNLRGFFDTGLVNADTMNPMQREFIRLAQIFKSQMIAEVELKQRVIERALIEDPSVDESKINEILERAHKKSLGIVEGAFDALVGSEASIQSSRLIIQESLEGFIDSQRAIKRFVAGLDTRIPKFAADADRSLQFSIDMAATAKVNATQIAQQETEKAVLDLLDFYKGTIDDEIIEPLGGVRSSEWISSQEKDALIDIFEGAFQYSTILGELKQDIETNRKTIDEVLDSAEVKSMARVLKADLYSQAKEFAGKYAALNEDRGLRLSRLSQLVDEFVRAVLGADASIQEIRARYVQIMKVAGEKDTWENKKIVATVKTVLDSRLESEYADLHIERAESLANRTRSRLDHKKLLGFLIDEHEEKYIELVEGTRAHIATIDNYLKRLAIAMEDDFKLQFYDPAWKLIRCAATEYDVSLGQIERTTLLTNNRAFAKVSPQATMEFDLPKRKIAIVEALDGARALAEDYGALLNDPTFLASFQMLGGAKQASTVKNLLPGLPTSTDQSILGHVDTQARQSDSSLQSLVPDPEVYKFETGTGFEIRPVIQPDGDSVIYDFNYMYTTNVREPIGADEKHLGRIKRHFIDTQVQTSSFELREISRYQVALKAARTSKGVPLLEDIPVAGALFRPAASDESALQQNIILGSTTVYPTLFDLMGLRWAPQIVELDHERLLNNAHITFGRRREIRNHVFDESSGRFDNFLQIKRLTPKHYRPDLYHENYSTSKYHPNGYTTPGSVDDPTKRDFERRDRRPPEYRQPEYDIYRHRPVRQENFERIETAPGKEPREEIEEISRRPQQTTRRK